MARDHEPGEGAPEGAIFGDIPSCFHFNAELQAEMA